MAVNPSRSSSVTIPESGGSSTTSDTTVHHIHVNITDITGETVLRVERNPDLGTVPDLTGHLFVIYYRIESPHLESSQVGSALIEFSIKEQTLTSLGLKPEDVVLMHWNGTRWVELPTAYRYSTGAPGVLLRHHARVQLFRDNKPVRVAGICNPYYPATDRPAIPEHGQGHW